MTTMHDAIRFLLRGGPNTEENVRRMLLAVDADEKGYETLEDYEEELRKQDEARAAGNQAAMGVEQSDNPDPRDAEIANLRAQLAARDPEPAQA